jgi:hypothetical protein
MPSNCVGPQASSCGLTRKHPEIEQTYVIEGSFRSTKPIPMRVRLSSRSTRKPNVHGLYRRPVELFRVFTPGGRDAAPAMPAGAINDDGRTDHGQISSDGCDMARPLHSCAWELCPATRQPSIATSQAQIGPGMARVYRMHQRVGAGRGDRRHVEWETVPVRRITRRLMLTDHGCLGPAAIVVAIDQGRVQTELLAHMELPAPLRPLLVPLHPIPHVTRQ